MNIGSQIYCAIQRGRGAPAKILPRAPNWSGPALGGALYSDSQFMLAEFYSLIQNAPSVDAYHVNIMNSTYYEYVYGCTYVCMHEVINNF